LIHFVFTLKNWKKAKIFKIFHLKGLLISIFFRLILYQQHDVAQQSLQIVPFILKPVRSLVRNDINDPGIQNIQHDSPVRRNNLPTKQIVQQNAHIQSPQLSQQSVRFFCQ